MMRAVGSASPMMRLVAATAAFASLYFLVAVLTRSVIGDTGLAVLWPASGVYLGVMLVAPRHMWSALACGAWIGSLAAYLHAGSSLEVAVAFAVPSSAEGLLGALLVERMAGKRFALRGLRDVFVLVLGGAVVANALVGLSAGAVAAQTFGVSFGESWLRWWSADALGVIAVAPIITAPVRPRGLRAAAVGGLGVALVVTHTADGQLYTVQAFLAVLLLSWLALAVALTERERALTERERALTEGEQLREGTTEKLDEASQRVAQLTAELAARSAELHDAGQRRERLAEEIRNSQAARGRSEQELADARSALAEAEHHLDRLAGDLAQALAERDHVRREREDSALAVGRLQAELGDAAGELANARAFARALEEELEGARAEHARTSEQLLGAMSERQRVEQELERLQARFEGLRGELERTRGALEEELESARAEQARTSEQLAGAMSDRQRVEQELERLRARFESLRGELERTQRARGQADQALVQGRAQFAEQRQRLERSLEEATRRLARAEAESRLLADRATELSSRYDDRGTCLDASPAFCQLLGYEREELVGRPGAALLHVEDRPRLVRARATRSDTSFEARLRRKAGDFVWVEVSLHPVWDSAARRLLEIKTTVREISEKRTATQTAA